MCRPLALPLLLLSLGAVHVSAAEEPPAEWIDPDTGHRIVRLSKEPGSSSLYFHQNPYTPDGRKLLITTPGGLATVDLKTREVEKITEGRVNPIMTGHKTGRIYYMKDGAVLTVDPATKAVHEVAKLPQGGRVATVNADETLLAGTITESADRLFGPDARPASGSTDPRRSRGERIQARFEQHLPMKLFTIDTATGALNTFHPSTNWLNHLQFSPTDPTLLLFCHEGPWHEVDRTWIIRADGTGLKQIHPRTMKMEIGGHEFFGADGQTIWYDLQTPRGEVFWLAGYDLKTGRRTWYHHERNEWSVHYNVSADGKLFSGDGGDAGMVARAPDGKWLYLFRPELVPDRMKGFGGDELIRPGVLKSEKLVNMAKHDYALEPNLTFTPDMKWLVFRSNMHGPSHVYAVEVAKAAAGR
jgi:oligogalacturonide lyase